MANQTNLSLQEQEEQEHYENIGDVPMAQSSSFFASNVQNFIIFLLICLAAYLAYEHLYKGEAVPTLAVPGRLNTFYF
jgi:hypothetical protein